VDEDVFRGEVRSEGCTAGVWPTDAGEIGPGGREADPRGKVGERTKGEILGAVSSVDAGEVVLGREVVPTEEAVAAVEERGVGGSAAAFKEEGGVGKMDEDGGLKRGPKIESAAEVGKIEVWTTGGRGGGGVSRDGRGGLTDLSGRGGRGWKSMGLVVWFSRYDFPFSLSIGGGITLTGATEEPPSTLDKRAGEFTTRLRGYRTLLVRRGSSILGCMGLSGIVSACLEDSETVVSVVGRPS
jgi:hypothetical protein